MSLQQETGAKPLAQGWLAKRLELPAWEQVGCVGERLSFLVTANQKPVWGFHKLKPRCYKVFEGKNAE